MSEGKKYISTAQLSTKLAGRSRTSLHRDVKLKRLPKPVRIGGRNYFDEDQVDKFLIDAAEAA